MIWVLYFVGHFFHTLAKATAAVRSKMNPLQTVTQYVAARWAPLSIRLFLTTVLFMAWWSDPTLAQSAFKAIGTHLSAGTLKTFLEGVSFPLNPATAAIYGYASDSILDKLCSYVPWLQNEIPKVNGVGNGNGNAAPPAA
jgi:hypothetical protein